MHAFAEPTDVEITVVAMLPEIHERNTELSAQRYRTGWEWF
jgi:hypothetical protein